MHSTHSLIALFCANFALFGAGIVVVGATAPAILRDFSWSYLEMGGVLAAGSAGYFASTFVCGVLVRRLGLRPVVVWGLLLQTLGLACFGLRPDPLSNLLALGLVGLGQGAAEVVTNYALVRLESGGRSRLMNLVHSAFTVGAIAGPALAGLLMERGLPWQILYRGMALFSLLLAALFALAAFQGAQTTTRADSSRRALRNLLRAPLLYLLSLVIFLYVGVEIGVSNWLAEYCVQVLGAPPARGAYVVSLFWGGVLVGRVGLGALYRGARPARLLLLLSGLCAAALLAALLAGQAGASLFCFLLCGVGCSAIYPVAMVLTGEHFSAEQGLAIGVVSTAGGLGSFLFPFAMSALAEEWGVGPAFWFYAVLAAALLASAAGTRVLAGRSET